MAAQKRGYELFTTRARPSRLDDQGAFRTRSRSAGALPSPSCLSSKNLELVKARELALTAHRWSVDPIRELATDRRRGGTGGSDGQSRSPVSINSTLASG